MKKLININEWERKENFEFFKDFQNPVIGVTSHVNCQHAITIAHNNRESFFLYYLYAIIKTINQIKEFKYRIDQQNNIVIYDKINVSTPVRLPTMQHFSNIYIPYEENRDIFFSHAKELIANADKISTYKMQQTNKEFDFVVISAVSKLPFSAITFTQKSNRGNDYPIIVVGQYDKDFNMPIALSVHHGFVDGDQISSFFEMVQDKLDNCK